MNETRPMNPVALQALRRLLFFSVAEAAKLIATKTDLPQGVSEQEWQNWESGKTLIPEYIGSRMNELNDWRSTALAATADNIRAQIKEKGGMPESVFVIWYETLEDWMSLPGRDPVMWRLQQAVCASLMGVFSIVRPVRFNLAAYTEWRGDREDMDPLRGEWASTL